MNRIVEDYRKEFLEYQKGSFQLTNNARRRIALGLVATRKFRRTREDCDSNDQDRDMKCDNIFSSLHHQPIRNLENRFQPIRDRENSIQRPKMSTTKISGTATGRKCTFRNHNYASLRENENSSSIIQLPSVDKENQINYIGMHGSVFLSGPEYKCGADGSKPCQNSLEISKGPHELTKISPTVTGTDQTRLVTPVQIRKNGTTTISNIIESFSDKNHYPNNKIVRQKHRTRVYLGNDMLTTKDIITDDNDTNGPATGPQPHVTHSDIDNTNDEASDSKTDDPIYANLPNISSGDSFDSSGSDKPKLVGILKSPGKRRHFRKHVEFLDKHEERVHDVAVRYF